MNLKNKSLIKVHFAVFLLGFTGLFARLLEQPVSIILFGRVIFSSLALFIVLKTNKEKIILEDKKDYIRFFVAGIILALHWGTFYLSIKLSTVAIGLITFSTFPIFVTFIEPYWFKEKIKISDILVAIVAFVGILIVVPKFEIGNEMTKGAIIGIFSGFTYAIFSIGNRKFTEKYSGALISFYEQIAVIILLIPMCILSPIVITPREIILIALLGIVFTAFAHTLVISSLKYVKTQVASVIFSLEPLYSIIAAMYILGEIPSKKTIIGGIIILIAVLYSTLKNKK